MHFSFACDTNLWDELLPDGLLTPPFVGMKSRYDAKWLYSALFVMLVNKKCIIYNLIITVISAFCVKI